MTDKPLDNKVISGSISSTIITLAVPVVLNMMMEFLLTTIDYYWVGKLGPTAQDAVTSSMVVIWTIFVLISIVYIGVTALVSRNIGAKDYSKAAFYAKQGIALAISIGTVISILGFLITPYLLKFMDTGEITLAHAVPYLRIAFLSAVFFFLNDTVYAVFRASGDTRTPTLVGITTVCLNMILDPLFIFGYGPFPKMGVAGAAVATAVAVIIGTVILFVLLMKNKLNFPFPKPYKITPKLKEMLKIARIGLPITTQQLIFVIVYWFLIKIVHDFGEVSAAAMGIGNRMESFSYLTCYGFSIAASTMVGQNLGAQQPKRAAKCAWGATSLAIAITFVMTIIFLVLPKQIAAIFSDDPKVIQIAADYLIILGLSQSFMAIEIVIEGAFSGAGDTIPPMVVMIPGSLARIPLAYLLAYNFELGINGVWWTLTITTFIKSLILALWFYKGNWQKKVL